MRYQSAEVSNITITYTDEVKAFISERGYDKTMVQGLSREPFRSLWRIVWPRRFWMAISRKATPLVYLFRTISWCLHPKPCNRGFENRL
jgi:hypothetical protein